MYLPNCTQHHIAYTLTRFYQNLEFYNKQHKINTTIGKKT
jgi:hypothetical protein